MVNTKDKKKEEVPEEEAEEETNPMENVVQFVDGLPADVRRRVFALYSVQKDYTELHKKYLQELRELEQNYEQQFLPFYERRKVIVEGTTEPTSEEISAGSKIVEISEENKPSEEKPSDEKPKAENEEKKEQTKEEDSGIPNFWLTAFKNNDVVQEIITQRDEECLKFLVDVACKNFDDPTKGFTLTFTFKQNPFFSNTTLTKRYFLDDDEEILLEKSEGCEISWLADKNLTVEMKKKKQKHKGSKNVRTVTTQEPCDSFFNFFNPPNMPDDEDEENEKDDEELEEIENQIEMDYEVGRTIKEKIIPKAVDWFTGEAVPPLQFPMGELEGLEEGDDDEDEDAPANERKHIKERKPGKQSDSKQSPQQQECKQQ